MSLRLTDLVKRLLSRPVRAAKPLTARLGCETLEDRTVPTAVVTIASLGNGTEGGGDVTFRLTRTDTTGGLTVNLNTADTADPIDGSGTATPGTDYTLPTTATFTNGQATVDVTIAAGNDSTSEPMEAVTLAVTAGLGYTVGTPDSATLYILDNDTPQANADSFSGDEDDTVTGNVLTNDTDPNSSTMTASLDTAPFFGTVDLNSDGSFEYTPDPDFFGTDVFGYVVSDGGTGTTTGTVTLTIAPADDDAPVIADQEFTIPENLPDDAIVGVVTASDPDAGQSLTYSITGGNSAGVFSIDPDTGVIQVADGSALNFEVTPVFALTVQVTDDGSPALSDTATIDIGLENLAEDVQNETEEDRIQYLNDRYDYIQGILTDLSPVTNGPTGLALDALSNMNVATTGMFEALMEENWVLYEEWAFEYSLALLEFNYQVDAVYGLADDAIQAATALVVYTEGDIFRRDGITGQLSVLFAELDYLTAAIGTTDTNTQTVALALALGYSQSNPLLTAGHLNLSSAAADLYALYESIATYALGTDPTAAGVIDTTNISDLNDLAGGIWGLLNATPSSFSTALAGTSLLDGYGAAMQFDITASDWQDFALQEGYYGGALTDFYGAIAPNADFEANYGIGNVAPNTYGAVGNVLRDADAILANVGSPTPNPLGGTALDIEYLVEFTYLDANGSDKLRLRGIDFALKTLQDQLQALRTDLVGPDDEGGLVAQITAIGASAGVHLAPAQAAVIAAKYETVVDAIDLRLAAIAALRAAIATAIG